LLPRNCRLTVPYTCVTIGYCGKRHYFPATKSSAASHSEANDGGDDQYLWHDHYQTISWREAARLIYEIEHGPWKEPSSGVTPGQSLSRPPLSPRRIHTMRCPGCPHHSSSSAPRRGPTKAGGERCTRRSTRKAASRRTVSPSMPLISTRTSPCSGPLG